MAEQTTTALDVVPLEDRNLRGLQIARETFSDEDRQQLSALLTVPADSPALLPFLALCVGEGFSPWANHVWLIPKKVKVPSADGEGETTIEKHTPMVGRDGLLHKYHEAKAGGLAKRLDYGTVCERDTFEAWFDDETDRWRVMHRQAPKPTEKVGDEPIARWRGRVIGAWSRLTMADGETHYFYAPMHEYARLRHVWAYNEERRKRLPLYWDPRPSHAGKVTNSEVVDGVRCRKVEEYEGAWDYESSMCLKAAQSYVCRIGLGVTGFVPADELRDVREWAETPGAGARPEAPAPAGFDFETIEDPMVREELREAIDEANALVPNSWPPAKCAMVLRGRSGYELRKIVEQVRAEVEAARARRAPAPEPEVSDAAVVGEDGMTDAERAARVEELRQSEADLTAGIEEAEGDEKARLTAQLDGVRAELKQLGA